MVIHHFYPLLLRYNSFYVRFSFHKSYVGFKIDIYYGILHAKKKLINIIKKAFRIINK